MTDLNRRDLLAGLAAAFGASVSPTAILAQQPRPTVPPPSPPAAAPPAAAPPAPRFGFEDVVRRARDLSALNYEVQPIQLPEQLQRLEFDQ